jgi:hypothetical protein
MSAEAGRSARSSRMLTLEAATVAIALVGAFFADGIVRLGFIVLIGWMLYVIVREIRSPGQPDEWAAAHDEPPGPFLVSALVFVLLMAAAVGILNDRVADGLPRTALYAVIAMVASRAADLVRVRLLRMPRFRQAADQG